MPQVVSASFSSKSLSLRNANASTPQAVSVSLLLEIPFAQVHQAYQQKCVSFFAMGWRSCLCLEGTLFWLLAYIAIKEVVAVIPDLLWIISFYVAAAVIVHRTWGRRANVDRRQYVLVAGNHQLQIEWYIRALQQFSQRTGMEIGITVVLNDSSDETGSIMEKFVRQDEGIAVIRQDSSVQTSVEPEWKRLMHEQTIWVELSQKDEITKLPL